MHLQNPFHILVFLSITIIVLWGVIGESSRLYLIYIYRWEEKNDLKEIRERKLTKIDVENRRKKEKRESRKIENGFATVVAPILVAMAAILLSLMIQIQGLPVKPGEIPAIDNIATNGLLCALAILALLGASACMDAYLDHEYINFGWRKRIYLAELGYLLFCLVVSGLNATIFIFYSVGERGLKGIGDVPLEQQLLFFCSSLALLGKMLAAEDYHFWFSVLIASYAWTFFILYYW